MSRPIRWAGGPFEAAHRALVGPPIDWAGFELDAFPEDLLATARAEWARRARTEFRSIQILTRFLEEVVGAGDPVDVYASAHDAVGDEIRHVALCAEVCAQLGVEPQLPEPVAEPLPDRFAGAPMADRALTTALSMLAINETISVAFITDLAARCETPGIREVLQRTIADEDAHGDFGWAYVEASLKRYPASTRASWRHLAQTTLEPHFRAAQDVLRGVAERERQLDAHPDHDPIRLGLFSPARQALVFEATWRGELEPRLAALDLR